MKIDHASCNVHDCQIIVFLVDASLFMVWILFGHGQMHVYFIMNYPNNCHFLPCFVSVNGV